MAKVLKSPSARANWRDVLDQVREADVVIERYGAPVAAIIPYEDYGAIREQLETLRAARQAQSAYAEVLQGQTDGRDAGGPALQPAAARARGKSRAPRTAAQAATALALEEITAKLQALQVEVAALRRQVVLDA